MKIDAFMPFYGSEFIMATQCMTDDIAMKYLRCCWYYWSQTKCNGLRDNDDELRLLCRCSLGEWPAVKAAIFNGEFFAIVDGLWHQKRCRSEYYKALKRHDQAKRSIITRWGRIASVLVSVFIPYAFRMASSNTDVILLTVTVIGGSVKESYRL